MATVRPFPSTPQLTMNIVPPSSDNTLYRSTNGLLSNAGKFIKKEPVKDLGSLTSGSNITTLKKYGITISQSPLTQKTGYILSTNAIPISQIESFCTPTLSYITNPDLLTSSNTVNIINMFTQGF